MHNKIIEEVYNDGIIQRISSANWSKLTTYRTDFEQFMFELLCNIPDDKLIELYNNKQLNYYLYYIAKAQIWNDKSEFWRSHKGRIEISYSNLFDEIYCNTPYEDIQSIF